MVVNFLPAININTPGMNDAQKTAPNSQQE